MPERSDKPLILVPGPVPVASGAPERVERRLSLRYPFTASAEIMELRSQTRVTGRSSDLGAGGCYIDTLSPFAVGAVVRVRLDREPYVFEAQAAVRYAHSSMGMGLAFTDIKQEHQSILNAWLSELSGESLPEPQEPPKELGGLSPNLGMQQVLNDLINLMVRKKVLSENEGAALLRQLFR